MRLAEVLGIQNPERNMQEVLEKALDIALDRHDPQKKLERRRKRGESSPDDETSEPSQKRSSYIPSHVRERVLDRASYCCEYRGPSGIRCAQRTGLEIDHMEPYACGGSHGESNLRVLCKQHNCFQAEREFGKGFIRKKYRMLSKR